MLSRYTDFKRLGQGGMGVVYRATDTQLHRAVALKFVTARFGSEDQARARFLREARMAAALNHPAICTIHEIGEVQPGDERLVAPDAPFPMGTPFIAMELIEGNALDALLRDRGRFAPAELLDIAIPIAEALAAAHAKGIVHRDLKPANVMVTPEGRPKILDFGLAKIVESAGDESGSSAETESAELTRQGQVLGTVAYMSPEQAQGKPVDLRSDIFSFGVMLYELAAGERPFRGDTPTSTLAKILESEPKPLGDIRNDLPGELLRTVRRCLRKKPEERVQSTGDLVVALKDLRQERASGPTRGWSDAPPAALRRGRNTLTLGASALILIAAVAAEAVVQGPGDERMATLGPDGTFLLYLEKPPGLESAPFRLMRVPVDGGAPELVVETNASAKLACPTPSAESCVLSESQDRKPVFYLLDPMKGKGREIGRISRAIPAWSLSPDGTQIAFIGGAPESGSEDMRLRSMRVSDGAIHDLNVPGVPLPQDLAWAPDGTSLFLIELVAKGGSPGWRVLHADLAGHVRVLRYSKLIWQWLSDPLPSPDGRYLAFGLLEFQSNAWSLENF